MAKEGSAEALGRARERALSTDDAPSCLREFEHLTLARIYIALYQNAPENKSPGEIMSEVDPLWWKVFCRRLLV